MNAAVDTVAASPKWVPTVAATSVDGSSIVLPGQTPDGGQILSVLLKRSYSIEAGQSCVRADEDQPLITGEVFWDTPMNSTVRFESDFAPYKLQTDVVLIARAYAPNGQLAQRCTVALQVGEHPFKALQVTGDRQAKFTDKDSAPVFTEPEPFIDMDLRFERAYGGTDVFSDKSTVYPYPRNPLGKGFAVLNTPESVENLQLPNLEDPEDPLAPERLCIGDYAKWADQPQPVSFGWMSKIWQPRCLFAGIMPADRATEQELRAAYAQLVPADQRQAYVEHGLPDMDFRFFNGASAGLNLPFLSGGEWVRTANVSPEGRLDFRLPPDAPRIGLDIGSGVQAPEVLLHTVLIRMEERQVDLIWRAAVPYPGRDWLPQMRKLQVFVG
ncbi:MAG: DUF2169 domain-containing protein [Variovorax sp.]